MTARNKNKRKPKSSRARNRRLARKQANTLNFETLEPKNLLAAITVSNNTDFLSPTADTSSISQLIANDGGDGISLREAITASNNTDGDDTVTFDGSVFTGGDSSVIRLTQGELAISGAGLTIDGSSVGGVVVTGDADGDDITLPGTNVTDVTASFGGTAGASDDLLDDNSRVLSFSPLSFTQTLTLTGLTITGGRTSDSGGGIYVRRGDVSLTDSTVNGNYSNRGGGGIFSRYTGSVSLSNSSVSGNKRGGVGVLAEGSMLVAMCF